MDPLAGDRKLSEIPYFCDEWAMLVQKDPDAVFLTEECSGTSYTRKQADELSARVYGWLALNGIGKEDVVIIRLPRDARPFIAMLGVWKAGAAFVVLEEDYAPERVEAIRQDCECRLIIDEHTWPEILDTPPRGGFVRAADHDLCFAIYTSGSTGKPKGVLQEYGWIRRIQASLHRNMPDLLDSDTVLGMRVPLYFVVSVRLFVDAVHGGMQMVVMTRESARDPVRMNEVFSRYGVNYTFITPSILRVMQDSLAPCLGTVVAGGERADGIRLESARLVIDYGMSETGFPITQFVPEKAYDVMPAGKPVYDGFVLRLLDENGQDVPDGSKGEICFQNPFFRGYHKMPGETAKAFRGGIFHTGDAGRRLEDGNLVITGRLNTMVKINGNRVEPGEIASVLRKHPSICSAFVRDFTNRHRQVFLCAYYTAAEEVPENDLRDFLSLQLPYYMIPSFFVRLDHLPLNRNGKVDRFALPEPDINAKTKPYVPPHTPEEEEICAAFAEVLGADRIGIHDDFFDLGGDSVSAAILAARLSSLQVEYRDLYACRTPEQIAYRISSRNVRDLESLNRAAMEKDQPLTPFQTFFYDALLYDLKQTSESNFVGLRFRKDAIDVNRLKEALEQVFSHYAVFSSVLRINDLGEVVWHHVPGKTVKVDILPIKEYTDEITRAFIKPYALRDGLMYRCAIYRTDTEVILAVDMNHMITDGTMQDNFMRELFAAYRGEPLRRDLYYYYLETSHRERTEMESTADLQLLKKLYDSGDYLCSPRPDRCSRTTGYGCYVVPTRLSFGEYTRRCNALHTSLTTMFVAAGLIALSRLEGESKVSAAWYYNGRNEAWKQDLMGMTLSSIPVALDLKDYPTPDQLLRRITDQSAIGLRYSECSLGNTGTTPGDRSRLEILYETGFDITKALPEGTECFMGFDMRTGLYTRMQVVLIDSGKEADPLRCFFNYDSGVYSEELVLRFAACYADALDSLKP